MEKKKKKITLIISLGSLAVVSIAVFLIFAMIILPKNYIDTINSEYELRQYENVASYNNKLNSLKNYLNDEEEYNKIQYKVKLSAGITLFEKKEYEDALRILEEITLKDDEVNNKINDCKFELGKKYIEEGKFEEAVENLQDAKNKENIDTLLDDAYCKLALKMLDSKDYKNAAETIKKAKNRDNENVVTASKKIHYEYGKDYYEKKDYRNASATLEKAKDYEDANTLLMNSYIENAEKYIKDDNLKEAKTIYDYLPEDVSYNGINASTRKEQLNRFADLINASGKRIATESYCESKNVWKYDGRWTNWYIDKPDSSEYITTKISLNNDGTINIRGTAYFYAFNDFSSLRDYCKAKIISKTIKIENVNDMPSSFDLDEFTRLYYNDGRFRIEYSKIDNYSTSFYNEYNSNVVY